MSQTSEMVLFCESRNTAQAEVDVQQGKSCELWTAMGLSELLLQQGKSR